MPLIPFDPDEDEADADDTDVTLTGIEVSDGSREEILRALRLNREMLHEAHPDANVDETAVRETIDDLLDQLNKAENP